MQLRIIKNFNCHFTLWLNAVKAICKNTICQIPVANSLHQSNSIVENFDTVINDRLKLKVNTFNDFLLRPI